MINLVLRRCAVLFFALGLLPFNIVLAAGFGSNLVNNGNADSSTPTTIPGWITSSGFTTELYGSSGFPSLTDPGPTDRGSRFFAGGNNVVSSNAAQSIDISFAASDIDTGNARFNLSAWLGGYSSQSDNASVTASFFDAAGAPLGQTATIGPVTYSDRANKTGLLQRETSNIVPAQARTARITMLMTRNSGSYNDGYADNISFVLTQVQVPTVQAPAVSRFDCISNWAERSYPQLFSPAATSMSDAPYTFRYYSNTGNFLAVSSADNNLFVLGPSFGKLVVIGPLTSLLSETGCP